MRSIVKDSKCGGKPRLSDTHVEVADVVALIKEGGLASVNKKYPYITVGDVALIQEYYKKNKDEIDDILGDENE